MSKPIILTEQINYENTRLLTNPYLDGPNARLMQKHLEDDNGEKVAKSIFSNAYKCLNYFSNPNYDQSENNLSKILCLGRVQSGKTGFFISAVSLAFDNGYDIAYLIGGTKNTLKEQNFNRITKEFENNKNVKIFDVNEIDSENVINKINSGYKVVLVSLKNSASNVNLGKAILLASELKDYASIVVDDEGDEYTPGAPKLKIKNSRAGATHDCIVKLISEIKNVTYLSVTATPQANFLISTIDEISPDYAVLVEPGDQYTGGNAFHDTIDNPHVIEIDDSDDFKTSVPLSFEDALNFFIFTACLTKARKQEKPLSMLVHPSALTRVQNNVLDKIQNLLTSLIIGMQDKNSMVRKDVINALLIQKEKYLEMNYLNELDVSDSDLIKQVSFVASHLKTFVFNISYLGKQDMELEKDDEHRYKIYIGGNMLGRGLTIKNLVVTYIYRDAKETAIDTLYQRARWLGYKGPYFDLCRVYMTKSLKEKFIATVDNENDMWDSLKAFLQTNINIKKFPRLFTINTDEKLILTRKSISKTITVDRVNGGFTYDKSLWFKDIGDKEFNRLLYQNYYNNHLSESVIKYYSNNKYQEHMLIETTYTEFFKEFLDKYILPRGSKFGRRGIETILGQIKDGTWSDDLLVIIMRHKIHEYRSTIKLGDKDVIGELLQSYDKGTEYPGDKNLPDMKGKMCFQIHLVYIDKNHPEDYVPILAFNNPFTEKTIKFVTGDNYYGED